MRPFGNPVTIQILPRSGGLKVNKNDENYTLKEPQIFYETLFTHEMAVLSLKSTCCRDVYADIKKFNLVRPRLLTLHQNGGRSPRSCPQSAPPTPFPNQPSLIILRQFATFSTLPHGGSYRSAFIWSNCCEKTSTALSYIVAGDGSLLN